MNQLSLKKYFSPWNFLYFALGLLVLFFLLRKIDFQGLVQLILKIKPEYLVLGGLAYLVKAIARSFRFYRVNARTRPGFVKMLRLSLASSLASQILPLKLGELSYVYLLKRDNRSSVAEGLSGLMVIRIFDLLAISLLFILLSLASPLPNSLSVYFYSILGFIGFLFVLIIGLLILSRNGGAVLQFFFRFRVVQKIPLVGALRRILEGIFENLKQYQPRDYLEWTALASLEWFVNDITFHIILLGIGLAPTFFTTMVAVTFAALASVLPVNSFGNFGTQEAGWATGLVLLGFSQQAAITSGFATHLLTLGYMLFFGGIAWLSYLIGRSPQNKAEEIEAR